MVVPLSATDIRIYTGVPFTRDYKHVRWFSTTTQRNNYFSSLTPLYSTTTAVFQKHDTSSGIFKAPINIENLMTAKYLIFVNKGKTYYCFVDNLEYENEKTTRVYFTLDIIQTYRFEMTVNQALIEREHTTLYQSGKPVINTLPEGLDYGDTYDIVDVQNIAFLTGNIQFMVTVCKEPFHTNRTNSGIVATQIGIPQPLSYYIHPFYIGSASTAVPTTVGGTTTPVTDVTTLQKSLWNSPDAVENVVCQYITDVVPFSMTQPTPTSIGFSSANVDVAEFTGETASYYTLYVKFAGQTPAFSKNFGSKYSGLTMPLESKLLMHPYTVYELTDSKGSTLEIRPEWFSSDDMWIKFIPSLGTAPKTALILENYKTTIEYGNTRADYQNGLIASSQSSIPIVSEYLAAYLQGNQNQLDARKTAAVTNGAFGVLGSIIGASGGKKGLGLPVNPGMVFDIASSVKDTALEFNNLNAQMKDISNIPANLSSMGDNANFDYGMGLVNYILIKKQIRPEYKQLLGDYFKMFGYKVSKLKLPNLTTRSSFNYVKCVESRITGATIPPQTLEQINSIFEHGVTLWHINDVGNYNVTNNVI